MIEDKHHDDDAGAWVCIKPESPKGPLSRKLMGMMMGEEYDSFSREQRAMQRELEKTKREAEIGRRLYEEERAHMRELMKEAAQCAPGEDCPAFDELKAEWEDELEILGFSAKYGVAYACVLSQRSTCTDDVEASRAMLLEVDRIWRSIRHSGMSYELAVCYAEALLDLFSRVDALEEKQRIHTVLEDLRAAPDTPVPELELAYRCACRCLAREEGAGGEATSKEEFVISQGVRVGFDGPGGYKAFLRQGRDERELSRYIGPGGSVRIPNGVTAIDIHAFKDCEDVEEVFIPDSVKAIYKRAFAGCTKLRTITGCEGLVYAGRGIFPQCPSIDTSSLPIKLQALLDEPEENGTKYSWSISSHITRKGSEDER